MNNSTKDASDWLNHILITLDLYRDAIKEQAVAQVECKNNCVKQSHEVELKLISMIRDLDKQIAIIYAKATAYGGAAGLVISLIGLALSIYIATSGRLGK